MQGKHAYTVLAGVVACLLLTVSGCPLLPCESKGQVTVLLSADLGAGEKLATEKLGPVDAGDIGSLVVTLTEISLDRASEDDPDVTEGEALEGEANGDGATPGKVVVFSGAVDIELRDLFGLSELISTAEIPAGTYTKIRLSIENPRMTLLDAPDVVIDDIQTTANGRLFVSTTFEVPADQNSLILLDFQGLHLVETGMGKYVWTPQLRAVITVEPADVLVEGVIESVDAEAGVMLVLPDSDTEPVTVFYAGVAIYLPEDTDIPTGTEADLLVGARVVVEGVLAVTGEITGDVIWLLADIE